MLELPAEHLSSPDNLAQALTITDAAMLIYDVTNAASLAYLETLSGTLHNALHAKSHTTTTPTKKRSAFPFVSSSSSRKDAAIAAAAVRPYHFLLVGTKSDVLPSAREVSWLEGQHAASELLGPGGASFLEVSARSGEGVGTVFSLLGREVLRGRREREEEEEGEARRQLQRPRRKRGASEGGAFGGGGDAAAGCECEYSDFYVDDDDHDDRDDGDGDTDSCDCADGGGTLRRRWAALKTTLSGSLFR